MSTSPATVWQYCSNIATHYQKSSNIVTVLSKTIMGYLFIYILTSVMSLYLHVMSLSCPFTHFVPHLPTCDVPWPTCDVPWPTCDVPWPTWDVPWPTCDVPWPTCDVPWLTCDQYMCVIPFLHVIPLYHIPLHNHVHSSDIPCCGIQLWIPFITSTNIYYHVMESDSIAHSCLKFMLRQ